MTENMTLTNTKAPASLQSGSSAFTFRRIFGEENLVFFPSPERDPLIAAPTCTGTVTHLPDELTFNVSNVQITEASLQSALRSKVVPRTINKSLTHTHARTHIQDRLAASSADLQIHSSCIFIRGIIISS